MNEIYKAIEHFEHLQKRYATQHNGKHCELVKTALAALREKAVRSKGCEYCSNISKYAGFGYAEWFEQKAADDLYEISVDVKFCPNCGRDLRKEVYK